MVDMDHEIYLYLEQTANKLCQYSNLINNPGLMDGKMGISIFLYRCSRIMRNSDYEKCAGELLDEIFGQLSSDSPIDFDVGLCGIGYGIDYLIKNKYVESESKQILENLDAHIISITKRKNAESEQFISAAQYWAKRGYCELCTGNIHRLIQRLTKSIENNVKTHEGNVEKYIVSYIWKLLLFYIDNGRMLGDNIRNLYEFMLRTGFIANNLHTKWSDKYVYKKIQELFENTEYPTNTDEIKLIDLLSLRNYNLRYGLIMPTEAHSKIQKLLSETDLCDEWVHLALPTTMHINGYMTGFGWLLLDMQNSQ